MADDLFRDTYQSYKFGTSQLARWLNENSAASKTSAPTYTTAKVAGNSKKQRAKSKRAEASVAPSNPNRKGTILNAASDFLRLAKSITALKKVPVVPRHIIQTLKDAICARKFCRARRAATDTKYDGHSFFIAMLEEVLQILIPHAEIPTFSNPQNTSSDTESRLLLANPFQHLTVEDNETIDALDEAVASTTMTTTSKAPPPKAYELQDNADTELLLALSCYFQDWLDVFRYVSARWTAYASSEANLIEVAATANLAIDLVRRIEENLHRTFGDRFSETVLREKILHHFLDELDSQHSRDTPDDLSDEVLAEQRNGITHARLAFMGLQMAVGTKRSVSIDENPHELIMRDLKKYLSIDDQYFGMTQYMDEELAVNMNIMLTGPLKVVANGCTLPADDIFSSAVRAYMADGKVNAWTLLAITILSNALGNLASHEAHEKPLRDLKTLTDEILTNHENLRASLKQYSKGPNRDLRVEIFKQMTAYVQPIQAWVGLRSDDPLVRAQNSEKPGELGNPRYLYINPMLCGMTAMYFTSNVRTLAYNEMNTTGICASTAHLYRACLHFGWVDEWSDMEYFLDLIGKHKVFSGEPPNTPLKILNRLCMLLGTPPDHLITDPRKVRLQHLLPTFGKHQRFDPPHTLLTLVKENQIGKQQSNDRQGDASLRAVEKHMRERAAAGTIGKAKHDAMNRLKWAKPSDLLASYSTLLNEELRRSSFDIMSFTHSTYDLLVRMIEHVKQEFPGAPFHPHLASVTGQTILTIMAHDLREQRSGKAEQWSTVREMAKVMQEYIKESGRHVLAAAEERLSFGRGKHWIAVNARGSSKDARSELET